MELYYKWLKRNFYRVAKKDWKITFEIKKEVVVFVKMLIKKKHSRLPKPYYYLLLSSIIGMFITTKYVTKNDLVELN